MNSLKVTCPWCRTNYTESVPTNCKNCGGNLPPADHQDRGAPPPPAPRVLPNSYKSKVLLWKNTSALLGFIFMVVGFPLIIVFGFGLIFFILGFFLYRAGKRAGLNKIEALENGTGYEGEILEIHRDRSESVNGRHPFLITYKFSIGGQPQIGTTKTWDDTTLLREVGDPLWIVHSLGRGGVSSVWPPLV